MHERNCFFEHAISLILCKISKLVLKGRISIFVFKFLWPSKNIQTLSIHLKGSYMHKPIKYIHTVHRFSFFSWCRRFFDTHVIGLVMEALSYIWSNLLSFQLLILLKVIIQKSRGKVSPVGQDTIDYVFIEIIKKIYKRYYPTFEF